MVWGLLIVCILAIGAFLFYASYSIASGVYLKAFCRANTREKVVALTFDDGPDPVQTPLVLDLLSRYQAKASFFCIGEKAAQYPEIVRRMHREGHLVGNHSLKHKNSFPFTPYRKMLSDLTQTQEMLEGIIETPVTFFRPPFGVTNPTVGKAVRTLGYTTIGWSVRSLDTRGESVDRIMKRITKQIRPGAVILLHDRLPDSVELLTALLEYLQANGYKVKRVDELVNDYAL
ncbi:polysaccharide deacetylase family protein [Parabacteroides sp. OttesenSCG-928-O15]|nr:polysaccharide deacetylase family protein [Parabacteroides sp. OttesenSCG-928-O15]